MKPCERCCSIEHDEEVAICIAALVAAGVPKETIAEKLGLPPAA